jgi:hypothetical protein
VWKIRLSIIATLLTLTVLFFFRSQLITAAIDEDEDRVVYLPVVQNRVDYSLGTPIFGVQVYGASYLPRLAESGAAWVRVPIVWRVIEPEKTTPPTYDWTSTDQRVQALTSIPGVNVILTIEFNPAWAAHYGENGPNGPIKQSELPRFATFVQAAVERYDGDGFNDAPGSPVVRYWEFYNEPDNHSLPTDRKWGPYPHLYAQMLATAYPAAKAANPATQVVFGGIAYDAFIDEGGWFHREFLDGVLQAGGGAHFDIMNFHSYPAFGWGDYDGPGLLEKTIHLREKLAGYGLDKPFVITEAGWHSNYTVDLPSTPEIQARYVVALFAQSSAAEVELMIWWMLHDPGASYPYANGLIMNDSAGTPKPAFYVFQNMVAEMSTTHYVRRLSAAETGSNKLDAYLFNDNVRNRRLYIAWRNPLESNQAEPLRIPAQQAIVYNMFGQGQLITDGQDGVIDGHVTLSVSGRPIYIEVGR